MREIKFRAWDKHNKRMIPWSPQMFSDSSPLTMYGDDFPENDDDFILMQFTGLHDKNSKEIFEGDILKWTNHTKCCNVATWDCLCEVVWESCGFYRRDILDGTLYGWANIKNEQVEVIGNIYEHPEMLKEPYAYDQD